MLFSRICALTGQTVRMLSAVKMSIPLFSEDSTASGLLLCLVQRLYRLPQPGPSWRKPPAAGDIAPLYGQKSGFPDSYRRKLPLSTVRNPIFQIPAVEACCRSVPVHWQAGEQESGLSSRIVCGDERAGFRPVPAARNEELEVARRQKASRRQKAASRQKADR